MKLINVEAGFCFCGGGNFSNLVTMDSMFIKEMRVTLVIALEATELVIEQVTEMAVELINNHLVSVQQKR